MKLELVFLSEDPGVIDCCWFTDHAVCRRDGNRSVSAAA